MSLPRSRLFLLTVAAAAALAVVGCGGDDEEPAAEETATEEAAGQPVATVDVVERDFEIDPKHATVDEAGVIRFEVTNEGETAHQLSIEAPGEVPETSYTADVGGSETFTAELDSGKYIWYCPIGNHRQMGMEGTLTVGGGGS